MALSRRFARRYERPAEVEVAAESGLKFPKPSFVPRAERVRDRSNLALPVEPPDRSRAYLDFVRGEICAVNADAHHECAGVTEAAHLEVHGKGVKASDFLTVPLCTFHHRRSHDVGIVTFQITYRINLWEVATRLLVRWVRRVS